MEPLVTSYSPAMVALSYLISFVGSFIALNAARRMVHHDGRINVLNTLNASIALGGIGVWAMHFTGMLAIRLPIGHGYSMIETLASLVAACVGTALALLYVARRPNDWARLLVAGVFLGMGVVFMHYLGMSGMRFGGYFQWSTPRVAASVAIAIVAATAALWLAFNTRGARGTVGAALVMGLAVCAMHYTGMSAADFICTTTNRLAVPDGTWVISSWRLPSLVFLGIGWLVFQLGFDQLVRWFHRSGTARKAA